MGWFTRFTRFGDVHLVYSQEGPEACGLACVRMVVFKVNKFDPGKVAITTEGALYKAYEGVTGVPYDGQTYTEANHLASVLSQLTSGTWVAKYVGAANVPKAIIDNVGEDIVGLGPLVNSVRRGFPVIVLVGWGGRRWTFCGHRYG